MLRARFEGAATRVHLSINLMAELSRSDFAGITAGRVINVILDRIL
jgi:hypothetical protein